MSPIAEPAKAACSGGDVAVVKGIIATLGALDVDKAVEMTTEDFVLEFPFRADGGPRRLEGEAAHRFLRALPRLFVKLPFTEVVVHGQLPSGLVVAEYKSDGLTRSGTTYANTYVGFLRLREGRVAQWREYFDPNVVASAFS